MKEFFVYLRRSTSSFWARRGYAVVICLCFLIVGATAWATQGKQNEAPPAPSLGFYSPQPTSTPQPVMAQTPQTLQLPTPLPLALPVDHEKTGMGFHREKLVFNETTGDYRLHPGIDYLGEEGTPVRALMAGTVQALYLDPFWGQCILLDHQNGYESLYAALSEEALVAEGEQVAAGQAIGLMGNSALSERAEGVHVHIELYKDGQAIVPHA